MNGEEVSEGNKSCPFYRCHWCSGKGYGEYFVDEQRPQTSVYISASGSNVRMAIVLSIEWMEANIASNTTSAACSPSKFVLILVTNKVTFIYIHIDTIHCYTRIFTQTITLTHTKICYPCVEHCSGFLFTMSEFRRKRHETRRCHRHISFGLWWCAYYTSAQQHFPKLFTYYSVQCT